MRIQRTKKTKMTAGDKVTVVERCRKDLIKASELITKVEPELKIHSLPRTGLREAYDIITDLIVELVDKHLPKVEGNGAPERREYVPRDDTRKF